MMPEMDGVTFLSMVGAARCGATCVIVLTGTNDRDGLISRVWKLGVSDVIPKAGFGVGDLFDTIRRHLPHGPLRRLRPPARTFDSSGTSGRWWSPRELPGSGGRTASVGR